MTASCVINSSPLCVQGKTQEMFILSRRNKQNVVKTPQKDRMLSPRPRKGGHVVQTLSTAGVDSQNIFQITDNVA